MMNETFLVASIEECAAVLNSDTRFDDYLWRETQVGCKVLRLLQEIHKFNITYVKGPQKMIENYERQGAMYELDEAVDIYVKPRTLWTPILFNGTPIMPILSWRFGFTLLRPDPDINHFFSLPFSATVWRAQIGMVLLASVLFYILNCSEQRLLGRNLKCYFSQELLIAIGAICQHYLPINPIELTSRRIAFFVFFLFCYIIYSYYTSTLLSDLVHDKNNDMDLETLARSTYGHVVLDSVAVIIQILIGQLHNKNSNITPQHLAFIKDKLTNIQVVNVSTGLAEVKTGKTALLSDYISLYWTMKEAFTNDVICGLVEVDLFSNVLKYLFTSKDFKYIEEFKISTLWAAETGVLRRLLSSDVRLVPPLIYKQCAVSHFQAHIEHVKSPLIILAFSYVLCLLIMFGERVHFNLPINPIELTSRRIAFFVFFLFCYIIYSYYTSTLLSDLVHDKNNDMDLETLARSTYGHVVLDSVAVIIQILIGQLHNKNSNITPQHLAFIKDKLTNIQVVNVSTGLAEVKTGKTALLSDYISLYWTMKEAFTNDVICGLVEVDLFSNVLKYLFTSKDFKYIEEFKISTLWAAETGVLRRLLSSDVRLVPPLIYKQCAVSHFQAHIEHVKSPLIILAFSYVLCLLIMFGERVHFSRYKVWPYVD